jgi:uncharacterized 2Fe-2S/4Fe-4S cluster protein (DUF4445 family)
MVYLSSTEVNYVLAKDPVIKMIIVAASWMTAMVLGSDPNKISYSPQNPAVATMIILNEVLMFIGVSHTGSHYAYSFMFAPYIGSIMAVLIHEFAYKPSMNLVRENQGKDALDSDESEDEV